MSDNSRVIKMVAGDSLVYLEREGYGKAHPLGMDITYRHKEYTELSNGYWELVPGDVLSFPHDWGQSVVAVMVKTEGLWANWDQMLAARFPGYSLSCPALRLSFLMVDTCPHCGTADQHVAEIVDLPTKDNLCTIARRYVVRTCRVCDNSWEQEAR